MTMSDYLAQNNISRYQLSKQSGVPWATLADICSGKTKLERFNGATLMKLSSVLGATMEELMKLDEEPPFDERTGFPKDKAYLEVNLPASLQGAIRDYDDGVRANSSLLDCLWGELYGAINAHQHSGRISKEQADHLRAKYLFNRDESDD